MSTTSDSSMQTQNNFNDFGFIDERPYCYSWTTNRKGVKVPIFPYVISILGHLNLKKIGVPEDKEEHAQTLMKRTLSFYLEQVVKEWGKKEGWHNRKADFPLIILMNIADQNGELVTEVVEKLQEKYPFVRLIAVLPLKKEDFFKQFQEEGGDVEALKRRCDKFESNPGGRNLKYLWELTEKDLSSKVTVQSEGEQQNLQEQMMYTKWRRFNEFVALRSHLMIVFWAGKKDPYQEQDDSLTWAVRYKLEGYCGNSLQGQTEIITYPAIGPTLHIQTDPETLKQNGEYLPAYFYSDRATITRENAEGKRELIIDENTFVNLEECRHWWFWVPKRQWAKIAKHQEILNNCKILKSVNRACLDTNAHLTNPSILSFIRAFVVPKYQASQKTMNPAAVEILQPDKPTGQLIASFAILDQLAHYFGEKTKRLTNRFCQAFLLLLVFNAFLIYFNSLCVSGFGKSCYTLFQEEFSSCAAQQTGAATYVRVPKSACKKAAKIFTNVSADILYKSKVITTSRSIDFMTLQKERIMVGCFVCHAMILMCILVIFVCCYQYFHSWHYKYHQFQTLADCVRVQVLWRTVGMDYSVSNNFRSHQIPAIDWLTIALNGLNVTIPSSVHLETNDIKERIKLLDTVWIEDCKRAFSKEFKKSFFNIFYESLTLFSKLVTIFVLNLIAFVTAIILLDIWIDTTDLWYACLYAIMVTLTVNIVIFCILGFRYIWKKLSRSELREITYPEKIQKQYFRKSWPAYVFQAILILYACSGVFFELSYINSLCLASQDPTMAHLYNFWLVVRLVFQCFLSVILVYWLYCRMNMFLKDRRRIEQLYYPFELADYSIDTLLEKNSKAVNNIKISMWDQFFSWFKRNPEQTPKSLDSSQNATEEEKIELCQKVLLELGQEVLAKRADWLLAVSDRNLQTPK